MNTELVQQLINRRKMAGISQLELAERVGTTQSHLSRIEVFVHEPRLEMLCRMANELGMKVVLTELEDGHGGSGKQDRGIENGAH